MSSSMESIYREEILEHYKRPHNWGHLDPYDLEFEDTNPLCGDELKVEIKVDADNKIEDLRFSGHGCAISQASASMTSDEIKGMSIDELLKLDRQYVLDLLGITISATRMKCALLTLKVSRARRWARPSTGSRRRRRARPKPAAERAGHGVRGAAAARAPSAGGDLRSQLDEARGSEVAVERECLGDPALAHDREACRVDEGVLALVVAAQPTERVALEFLVYTDHLDAR